MCDSRYGVERAIAEHAGLAAPTRRDVHPVVAIFYGEVDAIGEVSAPQINAAFPSAIVRVFSRSGHYPWIEAPGTFYRELNAFIARL